MMSTATKAKPTGNYDSRFSFDSEALTEHAAQYINDMIMGAAAQKTSANTLLIQAKTKSSLNEAEDLLHDLGGKHIKH